MRILRLFIACWLFLFILGQAWAGVLTRAELARRFPAPLVVGEKEADLPVWPLFKQNATATELVGYVFESVDLAPIPGFSGVPVNLLIAINPQGSFLDVAVLSQHEPVFLDGLGEAPLFQFVKQYQGLSLKQNIAIDAKKKRVPDATHADIDGVSKATASVRIINQSVLASALKVSRKKLGFAQGRDPDQIARIRMEVFEQLSVAQMLEQGLIQHVRLSNKDVESLFAGSPGAGLEPEAARDPDGVFIDLYLAYVSVPSVGRNLLTERSWSKLRNRLDEGDHAILVMSRGRYSVLGDDFVRGTVPERLLLKQDGLPIDMRDLDLELSLADAGPLPTENIAVLRVISQAGLDAASPLAFTLSITRSKGIVYPERIARSVDVSYRLPAEFYTAPQGDDAGWRGTWKSRKAELLLLVAGLALLAGALAWQKRLVRDGRQFAWFHRLFLLFTIGFIGYYAQGQLSIVNLTGAIQALLAGRSLGFFLFDPMTVILWAFVLLTLFIWGRGTFCGWLCPFGALQEFTGKLGQWLRLPQWKIKPRLDGRLKWIKYGLLAAILGSSMFFSQVTDKLVELEPFKTAITLNFVRAWPFVAYAVGLLLLSSVSYKFFCRYLCPFGAALALLGRFRLLDWIPRRQACGTPCQTCRHRCEHHAIAPSGKVDYGECFQCMDCVVIYASDEKCAPLMLEIKRARTIAIVRATPEESSNAA